MGKLRKGSSYSCINWELSSKGIRKMRVLEVPALKDITECQQCIEEECPKNSICYFLNQWYRNGVVSGARTIQAIVANIEMFKTEPNKLEGRFLGKELDEIASKVIKLLTKSDEG